MAGPEFHQTVMGHRFIEGTVPRLVEQLTKLNENIEKLIKMEEEKRERRESMEKEGRKSPYVLRDHGSSEAS